LTAVTRFWPLLCGTHRYEKTLSTRGAGAGVIIEAPILAYLIETANGRILYDVGCDYRKLSDPALRARWYENPAFPFGPPEVAEADRLPARLARLGLDVRDIDCVVCGHLHFDHGGGLHEFAHAEVHVHRAELQAMREQADEAYFRDDFAHGAHWFEHACEATLSAGVQLIETPGHTAGHMSLLIELPEGKPVLLCGDAADLQENLDAEIAPGLCWHDRTDLALASIRKLKRIGAESGAELWPNHDMAFFRARDTFPVARR
jgi:N-acyl homoserine lactone hydrolase